MSKITFRADDDLVRRLEEYDASKSEVMREALRTYLESDDAGVNDSADGVNAASDATDAESSIDEVVAERVDAVLADRLETAFTPRERDVNVNITVDGDAAEVARDDSARKTTPSSEAEAGSPGTRETCNQCGEGLADDAVYCSNCGEKAARRVFCECGDELRSDWGFCPGCGRRTPAADVLQDS